MRAVVHGLVWLAGVLCAWVPAAAHAQLRAGVGTEYYSWTEDTTPEVRERGGMIALALEYTRPRDAGLLWGYRGKLYFGSVNYEGSTLFPPHDPISSTTEYAGTSQEGQIRYRFNIGNQRGLDLVVGAGVDLWQRKLSVSQQEDFVIGFARLGIESERDGEGWLWGGGLKYPFHTWEDAHLDKIGFDSNPVLTPGKEISPYFHVGYRFEPLAVVFYVDSFRFSRSPYEPVTHSTQGAQLIFQPASTRYMAGLRLVFAFQ